MAYNCLVTKLKTSVQNSELVKLNEMNFSINANSPIQLGFSFIAATTIYVVGNGTFTVGSDSTPHTTYDVDSFGTIDSPVITNYTFSAGEYKVRISNKFNLLAIRKLTNTEGLSFSIDDLKYDDNFVQLRMGTEPGISGSLNNLPTKNVTAIIIQSDNIKGNINHINASNKLYDFKVDANLTGNIIDLASSSFVSNSNAAFEIEHSGVKGSASDLYILKDINYFDIYKSDITGSIEDMVQSFINAGTASMEHKYMPRILGQLTFGGIYVGVPYYITYLYYTSSSKIALTTGNTTEDSVYCKGYTQQEAEAAFPGMTVHLVDA